VRHESAGGAAVPTAVPSAPDSIVSGSGSRRWPATVKGHFRRYTGRLDLGARPAIELTIDAASVDTGNARRDRRLHSEDFFAGPGRRRFARACRDASPHGARRCQS
jgi:polyisoprenoid-binding protein YceI